MLEDYVEDLTKHLTRRREAELATLEDGPDKPDLVRGRSQAYGQAIRDAREFLEKHARTESAPEHLADDEPARRTYGHIGRGRAA